MPDRLNPGDDLKVIGQISSANGNSTLVMQGDGNLVLYRAGGRARWSTNTAGQAVASAGMQGDGNFVLYGPGGNVVWPSNTSGHPNASLVVQDDGNVVIYDPAGKPLWASNTVITSVRVPGFLPSSHGFHFDNQWPAVPDLTINVAGKQIGIGSAANGLCGGMAFAVCDFFVAGLPIPPDEANPLQGTPLFNYIVKRLFDSFNLDLPLPFPLPPAPGFFITPVPPLGPGPFTYMHLMNPELPDHETDASNAGLAYRGRGWVTVHDEWPRIKADLDASRPCPLAIIELKSLNPGDMGNNHQVTAYGYDLDGTQLTIHLYDPNFHDDDAVTMSLDIGDPQHTVDIANNRIETVWAFFRPSYVASAPPATTATASPPRDKPSPGSGTPRPTKPIGGHENNR